MAHTPNTTSLSAPGVRVNHSQNGLRRRKRLAQWSNGITFVASAWGIFEARPHVLTIVVLASLPLLALLIMLLFKSRHQPDQDGNGDEPNLAFPLLFPGVVLAVQAETEFQLITGYGVFILALCIGLLLTILAFFADSKLPHDLMVLFGVLFCTTAYGYGVVMESNGLLSQARPQRFVVSLTGKYVHHYQVRREYRLELPPWGPIEKAGEVNVSYEVYDSLKRGDRACIELYQGALRIPWYRVGPCDLKAQ